MFSQATKAWLVRLTSRLVRQQQAGHRAGVEHAGQIGAVAGEPELFQILIEALRPELRVKKREGAQRRGEIGALRRRVGDVVDQTRQADRAAVRNLLQIVPELLLKLDRGANLAHPHGFPNHEAN